MNPNVYSIININIRVCMIGFVGRLMKWSKRKDVSDTQATKPIKCSAMLAIFFIFLF